MSAEQKKKIALVLSGGGARGAYEAGIIHYIRTKLPPHISRRRNFDILCGSSVGAINTCFIAATSHDLEYQGKQIYEMWHSLDQSNIYRRDVRMLTRFLGRTFTGVFANLFRRRKPDDVNRLKKVYFKGLLDTTPFPHFLRHAIPWKQISLNIQNGHTKALTLTATNVHTGKVELFVDKHPSIHYSGRHAAHFINIEARHAIASASIPILFPTIRIQKSHYTDGGLRLNTPMSPAIQLGADKVLVIGLHHRTEKAEQGKNEPFVDTDQTPTLGEVFGQVLNSVFLDRLDYDLQQLRRINQIIDWGEAVYGKDFLTHINEFAAAQENRRDIAVRGLKRLNFMSIFPSIDIRTLFASSIGEPNFFNKNLSSFEKILLRILDVDIDQGQNFLSFMLFAPTYIKKMLELGFEDARTHHDQLVAFLGED